MIYYGWVIIWLSFMTMAFHSTARFSFSIFQIPLIGEFNWSRAALGGAYSLNMFLHGFMAPVTGSLMDRYGPRRVMPWGSVFVGAALAFGWFITSLWHVYLLTGLIMGIGSALSGYPMHAAIVPRWFRRKRGMAVGIVLSGIGIGGLMLSPTIERLIAHFSWRHAYLAYGLFVLLVLAPLNFFLVRNRPEEVGQAVDGLPPREEDPASSPSAEARVGLREALSAVRGDSRFTALVLMSFITGLHMNTMMSHMALYLVDQNYGLSLAAIILGITGFLRMFGSISMGWLSDRMGRIRALNISYGIAAAGLLLTLLIPQLGYLPILGFLFGIIYGFGMGGMASISAALSSDIFDRRVIGMVMGVFEICFAIGGIVGPPLAGLAFDLTGSYSIPITVLIAAMVLHIFIAARVTVARAD
ncbi:MAG: MFS transporter [bacterium]|nr:MFS transporter [bacterium]